MYRCLTRFRRIRLCCGDGQALRRGNCGQDASQQRRKINFPGHAQTRPDCLPRTDAASPIKHKHDLSWLAAMPIHFVYAGSRFYGERHGTKAKDQNNSDTKAKIKGDTSPQTMRLSDVKGIEVKSAGR